MIHTNGYAGSNISERCRRGIGLALALASSSALAEGGNYWGDGTLFYQVLRYIGISLGLLLLPLLFVLIRGRIPRIKWLAAIIAADAIAFFFGVQICTEQPDLLFTPYAWMLVAVPGILLMGAVEVSVRRARQDSATGSPPPDGLQAGRSAADQHPS